MNGNLLVSADAGSGARTANDDSVGSGCTGYTNACHQDYLTLRPDQPYIVIDDWLKISHLKHLFPKQYRAEPVPVGTKN